MKIKIGSKVKVRSIRSGRIRTRVVVNIRNNGERLDLSTKMGAGPDMSADIWEVEVVEGSNV